MSRLTNFLVIYFEGRNWGGGIGKRETYSYARTFVEFRGVCVVFSNSTNYRGTRAWFPGVQLQAFMGHSPITPQRSGRTSHHEAATSGLPSLNHSLPTPHPHRKSTILIIFLSVSQQSKQEFSSYQCTRRHKTTGEIAEVRPC